MLRPDSQGIERVYLYRARVDMRRQIDGLSLVAKEVMQIDPMSGALFGFINARGNKLKLLIWSVTGLSSGTSVWNAIVPIGRATPMRRTSRSASSNSTGCSMATMCGA